MLRKNYCINYDIQSGRVTVNNDEQIIFREKDAHICFLQITTRLSDSAGVFMKLRVKKPNGEIVDVGLNKVSEHKCNVTYRAEVPNEVSGDYMVEIEASYSNEVATSDIFSYKVKENLK